MLSAMRVQDLVSVFVGDDPLELVIQSEALHVEVAHHLSAVDSFGVLEFVLPFLFARMNLVRQLDLVLDLIILLACVHADVIFELFLVVSDLLSEV